MPKYSLSISGETPEPFGWVDVKGSSVTFTLNNTLGSSGPLPGSFKWTGNFAVNVAAGFGSYPDGTYAFSGGKPDGSGYKGRVHMPPDPEDEDKDWTATESTGLDECDRPRGPKR